MAKKFMKKKHVKQLKKMASNPAVRYLAAGFISAVSIQVLRKLSERYPEISEFLKENLELVEDKVANFRSRVRSEELHH